MSLPTETPAPDPRVITQALEERTAGDPLINDPVRIYSLMSMMQMMADGNIMSFSPQRRSTTSRKRDPPTPQNNGKRQDTTSSPLRSIFHGAATFVSQFLRNHMWILICYLLQLFTPQFTTPNSLAAFEDQSNYVGLGIKSRVFCDMWFSTKWDVNKVHTYRKNVAPCMTPEKCLYYQIFVKLNTHVADPNWIKFTKTYVGNVKDKLDVSLRRDVLENSMPDHATTNANDILKSLTQVYEGVNWYWIGRRDGCCWYWRDGLTTRRIRTIG